MGTSVEDIHEWNWKDIWLLGTGQIGNVSVKWNALYQSAYILCLQAFPSYLLGSSGLGDGQRDTKDGIGSELGLVGGSVQLDQELIDLWLILDIDVLLDDSRANDIVDIGDSLKNTLSGPLALVAVTKFAGLVLSSGSSGWDNGAVKASLGDNVNLNGWVTTRVVDGTCVDLGDGHVDLK